MAKSGKIVTVAELLDLSETQEALMEMELALAWAVRRVRKEVGISQAELAKRMNSSQPRVAALENLSGRNSIELGARALLALGQTRAEIGEIIASEAKHHLREENAKPKKAAAKKSTNGRAKPPKKAKRKPAKRKAAKKRKAAAK